MLIERFLNVGREFLGCKYPIMRGAMAWISDPQLVSAVAEAGGFGLIAGGNAAVVVLKDQVIETRKISQAPFGVNLFTLAPIYKDQLDLVCNLGCEFVVFAGGIPKGSLMAGQSVGLVNEIKPLKSIIEEMVNDAEAELTRVKHIID
jgi:enoyl-[acyl-carrier protein] reductase II